MKNYNNDFRFIIPAELEKSKEGEWKVRGLACTENIDRQGEKILLKGVDLKPIDERRGYLNFDHQKGPENLIGTLDGYTKSDKGIYVEGRLFQNHQRAQAVYEIMKSLGDKDKGRVGMSVEGSILERDPKDSKVIKKCQIRNVAITFNPVNTDTYADLVKSFNDAEEIEFDATEENAIGEEKTEEPTFTASQVVSIVQKALGIGAGYTQAADSLSGGDALSMESMDKKPKKVEDEKEEEEPIEVKTRKEENEKSRKKLPPMDKKLFKATM